MLGARRSGASAWQTSAAACGVIRRNRFDRRPLRPVLNRVVAHQPPESFPDFWRIFTGSCHGALSRNKPSDKPVRSRDLEGRVHPADRLQFADGAGLCARSLTPSITWKSVLESSIPVARSSHPPWSVTFPLRPWRCRLVALFWGFSPGDSGENALYVASRNQDATRRQHCGTGHDRGCRKRWGSHAHCHSDERIPASRVWRRGSSRRVSDSRTGPPQCRRRLGTSAVVR